MARRFPFSRRGRRDGRRHSLSRGTTRRPYIDSCAEAGDESERERTQRTNGRGTKAGRGRNAAPLGGSAPRHEFQTAMRARTFVARSCHRHSRLRAKRNHRVVVAVVVFDHGPPPRRRRVVVDHASYDRTLCAME